MKQKIYWVVLCGVVLLHVLVMLLVLAMPFIFLLSPDHAWTGALITGVVILTWVAVDNNCILSRLENWLRTRLHLPHVVPNFVSFYAKKLHLPFSHQLVWTTVWIWTSFVFIWSTLLVFHVV